MWQMSEDGHLVGVKKEEQMDANTCAWQWRISCVKKYSRCTEQLYHCGRIGFDFNVGSEMRQKLDLKLVTNGVILEICDFAKMVNNSKRQFIPQILENNFDLGLENEQQRSEFTARILHKLKDMMRQSPRDERGVFTLCDTLHCAVCDTQVDALNTDNTVDEDQWCLEASATEEMNGPQADDINHLDEGLRLHSLEELKADVALPSFPHCEGIGLNLEVGSKQSLDPSSLTNGVMLELVHFTRFITSYSSIVLGLLEHNFELDVKCPSLKTTVWLNIFDLLNRRRQLIAMFKNESFCFDKETYKKESAESKAGDNLYQVRDITKRRQRKKRAVSPPSGGASKRCKEEKINTVVEHTSQADNTCSWESNKSDSVLAQSYMCPLDSDDASDEEVIDDQSSSQGSILKQPESVCVSACTPLFTGTDRSFDVNPPPGDDQQTQIPENVPEECLAEEEDMQVESDMWKLRANRVKQIFLVEDQAYDAFYRTRKAGIEFNVGFGPKRKVSIDSLSSVLFFEIAKFALAMNSSQQEFIMEILEYNFDLDLQNENQRKMFTCDLMIKVRQLQNGTDSEKSSREMFQLPGLVSLVNMAKENLGKVSVELKSLSGMKECEAAPLCLPDSHAEATEERVTPYPFCEEIGLKLHVNHRRPKTKLELHKLSNGAMTEVTNFAERLCGTFEEIFVDIIRHNFEFDSQNGNSDFAANIISAIPFVVQQQNLVHFYPVNVNFKIQWSLKGIRDFENPPNSNAESNDSVQVPLIDQNVVRSTHPEQENELELWLWKMRANQIQRILSEPHLEHCPLYFYSKCKKVGIDFNVGSGVRQNLDPKLLTYGLMVELENISRALHSAHKYFVTEILEYNFDLEGFDLKNELNRGVFAQQVIAKVRAALCSRKYRLMKMPFELPEFRHVVGFTHPKLKNCPKCYQDRSYKIWKDECGPGHTIHPHSLAKTVSGEADCPAQQPAKDSSTVSPTMLKTIMHKYHRCRLAGLRLWMEKDQPREKLDTRILTRGIMREVAGFAKVLCGHKNQLENDIIKHNFNFGSQSNDIMFASQLAVEVRKLRRPNWFNERFVAQPQYHRSYQHALRESKEAPQNEEALSISEGEGGQSEEEICESLTHTKTVL